MACGKTVFFLLVIVALTSCAPAEKDSSSSREGDSPPNHEPPPYHQSPMNDNKEHQNSHGQQDSPQQQDKAAVHEQGANSNTKEDNSPTLEIPPSPFNNSEDHQNGPGLSGLNGFSFHMSDNSNDDQHDKAGLFGFDSLPTLGQMFFGGSNGSNPLDQLFQNSFHQIVDAIGMFIPGSNSSGHPNLFSGFMPHSRTQRSIELPGDAAAVHEQGANSNKQEDNSSTLEIAPSPFNNSEDHQDRPSFSGLNGSFSFHMFDNSNDDQHDRAGLFGFDSLPNFGQMFFGGSNGSNPLDQLFQNGFHQIVDAIGMFMPGSNSPGLPNLFSGFMPHSRSQRSIELPGDVAAESGTGDSNPHDRCLFSLFSHFFNSANSYATIGCNYTTQAGYSCSGCREQLICNTNNVGRIRICPRNAPYCYNGVCGSVVNTTACTTTTTG